MLITTGRSVKFWKLIAVNLKCKRIVIKLRLAFCIRYRMILAGEAVLY
uniref:Uncharacterized protein n=1 Tax=Anguilla anguilla TaxID=7936 RepID=A0A0E9VKM6_ANGAN